jgi:hypothetical protein
MANVALHVGDLDGIVLVLAFEMLFDGLGDWEVAAAIGRERVVEDNERRWWWIIMAFLKS